MTDARALFRPAAVAAAASEASADEPLRIVAPRMWIAGLGLVGLIVVAILWSAVFPIPITVSGRGILLAPGGVVDVSADAPGQIRDLLVQPGDMVRRGQIIARIEQPEIGLKLSLAEGELIAARRLLAELRGIQGADTSAQGDYRSQRSAALAGKIAALREQQVMLAERAKVMEGLARRGLITRERLVDSNLSLVNIDSQLADAESERAQLSTQARTSRSDRERELFEATRRADDAQRNVAALREQLSRTTALRSAFAGRAVEIKANVGQSVTPGTSIMTVERVAGAAGQLPDAILYVSASDGKKLKPGMAVEVSPSTSRKEEDGTLIGRVVRVSDAPASSAGMIRRLQNDQLVQSFTQSFGLPFEVEVALQEDPAAPGRPRWSTGRQPAASIDSGTLADARFTLRRMPLLALAIPALKYRDGAAASPK